MRKLIIIALVLQAQSLLIAGPVLAVWDIDVVQVAESGGQVLIKINMTGDGTALSRDIWPDFRAKNIMPLALLGKYIYRYRIDPDNTNPPAAVYALAITDRLGDTAAISDCSPTNSKFGKISHHTESGGYLSMNGELLIACDNIGNGNKTTLYLEVVP